jgi:peptide/nickel transport system substrate-binding protein
VVCTILALVSGCTPPGSAGTPASASFDNATPKRGGTLVAVVAKDPPTGNINTTSDVNAFFAFTPVFNALIAIGPNGSVEPDLATSWKISTDGLRYEFKLASANFHDATPVTAADVRYSVEQVAGKYAPKFTPQYSNVDHTEVPDAATFVVVLKRPSAVFLSSLAHQGVVILPKHIYDNGTDPRQNTQNNAPIGSGPYKFKEWIKGDHITLERNPDYFKPGLPYFDRLTLRIVPDAGSRVIAFQKGDVDILTGQLVVRDQVGDLKKIPGVQFNDQDDPPGEELLQFNTTRKPLSDVKVRIALATAIDRRAVVEKAFFMAGAVIPTTHIPVQLKQFHAATATLPAYDVSKAGQLLDAAGFPKGTDGTRMTLKLGYDATNDSDRRSAEIVRDSLKDVGVKVELAAVDSSAVAKEIYTDANFDLYTVSLTSNGDPELGIARFYVTSSIRVSFGNGSRYSNPEVDRLFATGASATDIKGRQDAYTKIQEILGRDMPTLPLADYTNIDFVRPDVGGVKEAAGYPYFYVEHLWRR